MTIRIVLMQPMMVRNTSKLIPTAFEPWIPRCGFSNPHQSRLRRSGHLPCNLLSMEVRLLARLQSTMMALIGRECMFQCFRWEVVNTLLVDVRDGVCEDFLRRMARKICFYLPLKWLCSKWIHAVNGRCQKRTFTFANHVIHRHSTVLIEDQHCLSSAT